MKHMVVRGAVVAIALATALHTAGIAKADGTVLDGSFSVDNTDSPSHFTTFNAGATFGGGAWHVGTGSIDQIFSYWQGADPNPGSVDLDGNSQGSIYQDIVTTAGHSYRIDFQLAGNPDGTPTTKTLNVSVIPSSPGATPSTFTFNTASATHANMGWTAKSFTFTATSSSTRLEFSSGDPGSYGPAIDQIVGNDLGTGGPGGGGNTPELPSVDLLGLSALVVGGFWLRQRWARNRA